MPQLTFRGVQETQLKNISSPLVKELASICQCAPEDFTMDLLKTVSFYDGKEVETYPFIEIGWFDRGQEAKDQIASLLYRLLSGEGVQEFEMAFKTFEKTSYYTNEKHYG